MNLLLLGSLVDARYIYVNLFYFSYMEGHVSNDTPNQQIGVTSINVQMPHHRCHCLVSL